MKALILAAGKGTRVQPLTYDLPKPMIPILGKPVLSYIIEHLAKCGVHEIMINVSHLHEKIEEFFGDGHQFGVQIGYSFEGYMNDDGEVIAQPLGSAGGMKKIHEFGNFFDETTIVLCGDAIIDLDIRSALFEHKRKGALASIITKEVEWNKVSDYGVVVADKDGRIHSFQEKPKCDEALSNFASTGIYIFEPEILNLIPSGEVFDIGSQLFPLLIEQKIPFFAQNRKFNWIDIGSVKDFWSVSQLVMLGSVAQMSIPGVQIEEGIWVGLNTKINWKDTVIKGPVYIGANSHIEAGCTIIGPTWIGHGSHICSGATLERCVLFEYTRITSNAHLEEQVVFKEFSVDRTGASDHLSTVENKQWGNSRDRRIVDRKKTSVLVSAS